MTKTTHTTMVSTLVLVLLAFTSHTTAEWVSVMGYNDNQCAATWQGVLVQEIGVCNNFLNPISMKYTYANGQLTAFLCIGDPTCTTGCISAPIPQNTCLKVPDRKRGLALSPLAYARRALDSSSSWSDSEDSSSFSLDSSSSLDGSDSEDSSSDWYESSSLDSSESSSSSSSSSDDGPKYSMYKVTKDFPASYMESGKTVFVAEYVNITCEGPASMYSIMPSTLCSDTCFDGSLISCKVPDFLLSKNSTSTTGASTTGSDATHEEPHVKHRGIAPVGIVFIVIGVLAVVAIAGVVGYTYGKKKNVRFTWGKLNDDTATANPDF